MPLCCCLISVAVWSGQAICLHTFAYHLQFTVGQAPSRASEKDHHGRMNLSNTSLPVPPAPEGIWVTFKVPMAEHKKLTEEVAK